MGGPILALISSKETVEFYLKKWLLSTYPTLGRFLAQFFYDEHRWSKDAITNWINMYIKPPLHSKEKKEQKDQKE
jgi:hypothetical protein